MDIIKFVSILSDKEKIELTAILLEGVSNKHSIENFLSFKSYNIPIRLRHALISIHHNFKVVYLEDVTHDMMRKTAYAGRKTWLILCEYTEDMGFTLKEK